MLGSADTLIKGSSCSFDYVNLRWSLRDMQMPCYLLLQDLERWRSQDEVYVQCGDMGLTQLLLLLPEGNELVGKFWGR